MYIVRVAKATRVIQINRTVRSKEKHMKGRADCLKWRADCLKWRADCLKWRADRLTSGMPVSLPCGNNHRSQHNPLDARRQPPESCMESEHGAELGELDAAKWFGEDVGRVLISRDMRHGDRPLFNLFVCDGISNSDNLRQRLFGRKPKGIGRGLEASPFADGNRISSRPCTPVGI